MDGTSGMVAMKAGRPARSRRSATGKERRGFALVTVVWSLGLLAAVTAAVTVATRYRARDTASAIALEGARVASESAVNLAIARIAEADRGFWRDPRFLCRLPDGTSIRVTVEPEVGKVDLNNATQATLTRLFTALSGSDLGQRLAARVVVYRTPRRGASGQAKGPEAAGDGPKGRPFLSVLELDQVPGVPPALLQTASRFFTTRSDRDGIEPAYATPAMRDLLHVDTPDAAQIEHVAAPRDVTIRADIRTAQGARFLREALVEFADGPHPIAIHEWRHADLDGDDDDPPTARTACLP